LATMNFRNENRSYPPGYSVDPWGQPLHGWHLFILPYLEQDNIYQLVRQDLPWDHAKNRKAFEIVIREFSSPYFGEETSNGYAISHYAGNTRALPPRQGLRSADFRNGFGCTILIGEVSAGFRPWGHPLSLRDPARGIHPTADAFAGPWSYGVTLFGMAD